MLSKFVKGYNDTRVKVSDVQGLWQRMEAWRNRVRVAKAAATIRVG